MKKKEKRRGRVGKLTTREVGFLMLFGIPTLLLFLLLTIVPLVQSFVYSFYEYSGYGEKVWVGLQNYIDVLTDSVFRRALLNDLLILIFKEIIIITMSVLFAVSLTRLKFKKKEVGFLRYIYYIPNILSVVVTSMVWRYFFNLGLFSLITGAETPEQGWIFTYPIPIITFAAAWCGIGTNMIILIAAINNISKELYEAAELDGAGQFRQLWYITLPSVLPQIRYMAISITASIIASNMNFVKLFMEGGSMAGFTVAGLYQYEYAFTYYKLGYAYAASLILTIILFAVSWIMNHTIVEKKEKKSYGKK